MYVFLSYIKDFVNIAIKAPAHFFIEPRNWTNRQADIVVTLIDLTYMSQLVLRSIDNGEFFFILL